MWSSQYGLSPGGHRVSQLKSRWAGKCTHSYRWNGRCTPSYTSSCWVETQEWKWSCSPRTVLPVWLGLSSVRDLRHKIIKWINFKRILSSKQVPDLCVFCCAYVITINQHKYSFFMVLSSRKQNTYKEIVLKTPPLSIYSFSKQNIFFHFSMFLEFCNSSTNFKHS